MMLTLAIWPYMAVLVSPVAAACRSARHTLAAVCSVEVFQLTKLSGQELCLRSEPYLTVSGMMHSGMPA